MSVLILKNKISALPLSKVWLTFIAGFIGLWVLDARQVQPSFLFTIEAVWGILPFILASVLFAAYAKATGLDGQVAKVFSGSPARSILLAALFGSFSPFCSCGVVPIIAGLLGAGVPLAPVMAFWIASPLMDPEMFVLMFGVFGAEMTIAKTLAAFVMGSFGGFVTYVLVQRGLFSNPLKQASGCNSCGCSSKNALKAEKIVWKFWTNEKRKKDWNETFTTTGLFLLKWLALAFFIESLMLAYIPADKIGAFLGNGAWWSVPLAVLAGIPAYLNGYAAIPTVSGLIELGMSPAAGLGFMIGGGVTSIPAAMAVYALVRRNVFFLYLLVGLGGAIASSFAYLAFITV